MICAACGAEGTSAELWPEQARSARFKMEAVDGGLVPAEEVICCVAHDMAICAVCFYCLFVISDDFPGEACAIPWDEIVKSNLLRIAEETCSAGHDRRPRS